MKYLVWFTFALACGCSKAPISVEVADKPFPFFTESGIEMTFLPAGQFTMGSSQGEPDEAPEHTVALSAFAIDRTEVTHEMFAKMQLPNPSKWQEDAKGPVNQVRWREAKAFCNERSLYEGLQPCYDEEAAGWPCDFSKDGYRLPTEAEWEYAARCGRSTEFPFGSGSAQLKEHAWFGDNSGQRTHPVASRKPNLWGVFDMYGNVSEWCHDVYQADYYQHSPAADPTGPASAQPDAKRVVRGGSWKSTASMCRPAFRQGKTTGDSDACFSSDDCGFRCVRRLTKTEARQVGRGN